METEVETEGNRFGRPSKWKQSGGGSKERSQRDMFPPAFPPFTAPVKQISATLYVFCRWRETATLKFYPNASENAAIQFEKQPTPEPNPFEANIRPVSRVTRRSIFRFFFLFKFLLASERERERGNTIDEYETCTTLSKGFAWKRITHRFFLGADGKLPLPPLRGGGKNGYDGINVARSCGCIRLLSHRALLEPCGKRERKIEEGRLSTRLPSR